MIDRRQAAEQFRKALQILAMRFDEESAMSVAAVYDPWITGKHYAAGEFLTYGVNGVGDPQLYKVIQDHHSQPDWTPDAAVSLFAVIGCNEGGYPLWSQPAGAFDAYQKGDIVDLDGTLYVSLIDGNTYSPEVYPAGWDVVEKEE